MIIIPFSSIAKKKVYENGDVYEGKMKNNSPNGKGTMTYADGKIYRGFWVDGVPQGQGYLVSPYIEYEGPFYKGQFYGIGKMTFMYDNLKLVITGFWEGVDKVSNAVAHIDLNNTTVANYKGSLSLKNDNLPVPNTGEGLWIKYDNKVLAFFNGKWNNGKFTGTINGETFANQEADVHIEVFNGIISKATIKFPNGPKYEGISDYYNLTGKGTLTTTKGTKFWGEWKNNKIVNAKLTREIPLNGKNSTKILLVVNPNNIILSDDFGEVGRIENTITPFNIEDILDSFILSKTDEIKERWEYGQLQKRKEEEQRLREEEQRLREEEERLRIEREEQRKREQFAKQFDTNYAGLTYYAKDASFDDSFENGLAMFLFQAKPEGAMLQFRKGCKVALKQNMSTASDKLFENMVMASMNGEVKTFDLQYDPNSGDYILIGTKNRIRISKDKNTVTFIYPSGRGFHMKRIRK